MRLPGSVVAAESTTGVVATHDPLMLVSADHVVELRDGDLETHR